ncbi:MAG: asparagine synthase (glutamine-hydrolyzing) [Ignavibacteriae bacterium]|nr:asparagine synthase (glutamine-hydrolyzing) [Ignavibacteriota bacterium]
MCGITGLFNIGNREILDKMNYTIYFRGPDDKGTEWFEKHNSGIGNRRLAILDLSPSGHMPMTNEKKNLWITYNGEIYNYREIRKELVSKGYEFHSDSDTEVVLKSYEEWGENCLERFNGMFAFIIYNSHDNSVFAARDRIGIKPFYYWYSEKSLIIASEIKAILESGLVEKSPDFFSLCTPTRFQIYPHTGFKDIFKLPAGCYLTYKNCNLKIEKYWDIYPTENKKITECDAVERLDYLLSDSVALQMISDVPVGLLLSGGLDSSIIASLMRKNSSNDIHAFTIKFSESDQKFEQAADDGYYSKIVSDIFGFKLKIFEINPSIKDLLPKMIWHLDEPLADPAAINTYLICDYAKQQGIPVLLNGMGGDEIFGGYRKQLACLRVDNYNKVIPGFVRGVFENFVSRLPVASKSKGYRRIRWLKRFLSFANLPRYERFLVSDLSFNKEMFESIYKDMVKYEDSYFYLSQKKNFKRPGLSYLTKMCFNDTKTFLPCHNLLYSDKASMAASVETRPPLVDHRIAEFIFTLPANFRIKFNNQKYLLKTVSERYLPDKVINRPKSPFGSPLRSWLRGPLSEMVDDLLSEESIKKRGFYDVPSVRNIIEKDRSGAEDNAHYVWILLNNELWFRTFFGN